MAIVSAMQPYLFPYHGYFQLISQSEKFVLLDDADYIKRGWSNRNFFGCANRELQRVTLEVGKVSRGTRYNQITIPKASIFDFQTKIMALHKFAKHPGDIEQLIEPIDSDQIVFSEYAHKIILALLEALQIETEISKGSDLALRKYGATEYILSKIAPLEASVYLNMASGIGLYDQAAFKSSGILLEIAKVTSLENTHWCQTPSILSLIGEYGISAIRDFVKLSRTT